MTLRAKKWTATHGYVVMAVPKDGLFVRENRLMAGRSKEIKIGEELVLFSRRIDADKHADFCAQRWTSSNRDFIVLPVLVSERL